MKPAELEAFWQRVDTSGGPDACWLWKCATRKGGYGSFKLRGKTVSAHRVAWEIAHGKRIPEGLVVRHKCDTPGCCNSIHLAVGTLAENALDRISRKGRRNRIRERRRQAYTAWLRANEPWKRNWPRALRAEAQRLFPDVLA